MVSLGLSREIVRAEVADLSAAGLAAVVLYFTRKAVWFCLSLGSSQGRGVVLKFITKVTPVRRLCLIADLCGGLLRPPPGELTTEISGCRLRL